MGRTKGRVQLVKIATALAAALPLAAGIAFAIGGEPVALVVVLIPAAAGAGIAALPLVLPERRFGTWVLLSCVALLVAGVALLWLGGLLLWAPAAVLAAAVDWRRAWRPVALGLAAVVALMGLIWGGSEAYKCVNPATTLVVRFHEPPSDARQTALVKADGVSAIGGYLGANDVEVEFHDGEGAARDRLAERLRRDPAVASVNARPEPCD